MKQFNHLVIGAAFLTMSNVVLSCGSVSEDATVDGQSESDLGELTDSPCSKHGDLEEFCEGEVFGTAKRAVLNSDLDLLRRTVHEFPSFAQGERGATLFAFSVCQPDAASMMINEWGFDVTTVVDGSGVVGDLLAIERGIDGTILQPQNLAGEVVPANRCEDPAAVYETLRLVLDAGASPCAAPVDDPGLSPVLAASEAGWEPEVTEILTEYADQC